LTMFLFFHEAEETITSFLPQQMQLPIAKRNKYKSIVLKTHNSNGSQKHSLKISKKNLCNFNYFLKSVHIVQNRDYVVLIMYNQWNLI
jgi:hypothetical protein